MKEKQTIEGVYDSLKALNIVYNQADFSRLCGKSSMWFSCLKARRLSITADAALTLAYKLRRKARTSICPITYSKLMTIGDELLEIAEKKIAKKVELSEKWAEEYESL
jgi:hypothetical protein